MFSDYGNLDPVIPRLSTLIPQKVVHKYPFFIVAKTNQLRYYVFSKVKCSAEVNSHILDGHLFFFFLLFRDTFYK